MDETLLWSGRLKLKKLSFILMLRQIRIICESLMKHSARSLRENGTPRACRLGGRCRDCYPGAPTLGRATAAHLGIGCPKFHLRAPDPRLGRVVSGPQCQCRHHDGRPGAVVPGLAAGRHAPFPFHSI